jgi:hypothetical protein
MANDPLSKAFKIDNNPLRQFALGCAWKCSVTGSETLRHYSLDAGEEKTVETALRAEIEESAPSGIVISIARLIDRSKYAPDFMKDGAIFTPFKTKVNGVAHIWFSLNEFVFEVALSSQADIRSRGEELFHGRRRLRPKKVHFLEHPFVREATLDTHGLHYASRYTTRAEKWLLTRPD